jgi:signal transduction histidine kinase
MNRLWVWLSIIFALIIIFTALFPVVARRIGLIDQPKPRPFTEELSTEQIEQIQKSFENRIWDSVIRTLLVGAGIGLLIGILLSRWLVNPLHQLEQGALAISAGRLDYRIPIRGSKEMKSVAKSFNHMADDLERGEELRQNMLTDVTHELRHPVHILQGNLGAILDGVYPLNMEEIARLLEQSGHLTALVDDLHELAQAEAQQLSFHKQDTDIRSLITNAIEIFQPLAANEQVALNFTLPQSPVNQMVDSDRIYQALLNLLSNALRYTPEGGEINVSLFEGSEFVEIIVQDTGTGIEPEHLPHVFDRFYRTDTSRGRDTGGTGLGLAIAQAIVQAHGGQIDAYSAGQDKGSTFTIRL